MSDQVVAGLRIDVNSDSVETADQKLARFTDRAKMSESQIRNLEAVAKRNSETFEQAAIRFGEAADRFHGLSDATEKSAGSTTKSADATERGSKATHAHAEELTRLQRVTEVLAEKQREFAGGLGIIGQLFTAVGPAGLAVAGVLGIVYEAISQLSESAERMAKLAKELSNVSQISGMTTTQVQTLSNAAAEFGMTGNEAGMALTRFATEMSGVRDGTGRLSAELRILNPQLLAEMSMTKDNATALSLLAEAYEKAGNNKSKLASAAGGGRQGAAAFGSLLGEVAEKGGVDALAASVNKVDIITKEQIETWRKLGAEIEDATSTARNNVASIYTTGVLEKQKSFALGLLDISRSLKEFSFSEKFQKFIEFFSDPKIATTAKALAGPFATPIIAGAQAVKGVVDYVSNRGTNPQASATFDERFATPPPAATKTVEAHTKALQENGKATDEHNKSSEKAAGSIGNQATTMRLLVGALGSAATPVDQYNAKMKALDDAQRKGEISADDFKRAVSGAGLEQATALINARVGALGAAASETDLVMQKKLALDKADQQGAGLTKDQIANQIRLVQEQYNGVAAVKAQTDAAIVQNSTIGMSIGAAAAYTAVQSKINEMNRLGTPLSAENVALLEKEAKTLGDAAQAGAEKKASDDARFESATMFMSDTEKNIASLNRQLHGNDWADYADTATAQLMRINAQQKQLVDITRSSLTSFANDFVSGMIRGGKIMDNLGAAAKNLSATLTSGAITSLFKGDFIAAAAQGIGAIVTGIFAAGEEQRKAEEKAAADALVRIQGYNSRATAAAQDTTTLAGQLQKFDIDAMAERQAEQQKGGQAIAALETALQAERLSIIQKSATAAQDAFNQLVRAAPTTTQAALKSITDAAVNLATALGSLGKAVTNVTENITTAVERLQHNFADGLIQKINTAFGADYLTAIITLARQHTSDLADAASLGINASLVNTAFSAQVQKLIDDGKLTGVAFQGIIDLFPELNGSIHEFSSLAADSAKTLADAITIATNALTAAQAAVNTAESALKSAFQSMLNAATTALAQSVNNLTSIYKTQFDTAQQNVISAYTAQSAALQGTIDKMKGYIVSLKTFQDSLKIGSLSTLNPTDQLSLARTNFEDTSKKANTGDQTALSQLQGVSQTYLDQAKSYFASSKGYGDAFAAVQTALTQAQEAASHVVTEAQAQMILLRQQVTALGLVVDNTDKINSNSSIIISALGKVGDSTNTLDANGKALNSAITELLKVQVMGSFIQQQYGITIDTSVKTGTDAIIVAINDMNKAYKAVVDAVNVGTEIQKKTGVNVFDGISVGMKSVVDAVNAANASSSAIVGTGLTGTILAVNGAIFAIYDAKTSTITAVNTSSGQIAYAVDASGHAISTIVGGKLDGVGVGLTGTISAVNGSMFAIVDAKTGIVGSLNSGLTGTIVAVNVGTGANVNAVMAAANTNVDAILNGARQTIIAANGTTYEVTQAGASTRQTIADYTSWGIGVATNNAAMVANTIAGYTAWSIGIANANANGIVSTIAGYSTWQIGAASNNAASIIDAVMNITNASNGTGAVNVAVNNLRVANDNLTAAQLALLQANNNQSSYLSAQLSTQAQQLGQLVLLNSNVLSLSANIARAANFVPASSEAADAAARAAAAAREAAKRWHYDMYPADDVGSAKAAAMEGEDGPYHAAYRARHPDARYEAGGLVTNGSWGKDSVNAMLAGGEFVMPAPQAAQFMPQLEAMRNGNGGVDTDKLAATLVRAMAAISVGETDEMKAQNEMLREQIALLIAAVRGNKPAPARPNFNSGVAA